MDFSSKKNQIALLVAVAILYMVAGSWIGKTTAQIVLVALTILAGWGTLKLTANPTYAFVASGVAGAVLHFSGAFDKFALIGANIGGAVQSGLWIGLIAFVCYQGFILWNKSKG